MRRRDFTGLTPRYETVGHTNKPRTYLMQMPAWIREDMKRRVRNHIGDARGHLQSLRASRDKLTGHAWLTANLRVIRAAIAINAVSDRLQATK